MWGADWKFRHEDAAEQLPEWRNYQFIPKNNYGFFFLHTLPSTIAFRLEYVLLYQFYAKITTFFDQEKFGTALHLYVDVEPFGGNWRESGVKSSKITLKPQNRHTDVLHEWSYTPHVRQHFLAPVGFTENDFWHTRPEFPWARPGLGDVVPSCMTSGRLFDVILSFLTPRRQLLTSFFTKRYDINVKGRSRTKHFFNENVDILA